MAALRRCLYTFLGLHSFLIGLFPFYIPVYLFATGFSLTQISVFVGVTGVGFCLMLYIWDRVYKKVSLRCLIAFSFACELLLISLFFLEKDILFIAAAALANGVFNCNFWIIQRLLFLQTVTPANSGRKFGNFQLFVMVVLKISIFLGGLVLESSGFLFLYLLSAATVVAAIIYFCFSKEMVELDVQIIPRQPLSLKRVIAFSDSHRSRPVFAIDGLFLYLESYFWVISLFLIVRESFSRLGLLVVVLTIVFGILFILIKNTIDRMPADLMFRGGVVLYCISWILRGGVTAQVDTVPLLLLLAVIAFCTSIFRLVFNKRFFDIARTSTATDYIIFKSYFSQFFLVLFLLMPLLTDAAKSNVTEQLSLVYMAAAFFSLVYLVYRQS